jgi:flavin-dependent dehydrogenase
MLLGDAAGLVDPFTGEGIGNAMASAKFAVEVAQKALKENDFSKKMFSTYHKLVWDELGSELRTSTKLQNLSNYRMLLNIIINKASRNKEIQDVISGMLTKEISKDKLSNPLFYLKVLFS